MKEKFWTESIFPYLLGIIFCYSCQQDHLIRYPAEFEPQEAIWISWYEKGYFSGPSLTGSLSALTALLSQHVQVKVVTDRPREINHIRQQLDSAGVNHGNLSFEVVKQNNPWLRDIGPVFIAVNNKPQLVDFQCKCYLYGNFERGNSYCEDINAIDRTIARKMGIPVIPSTLVSEGGNRESNGRGVMLAVSAVEKQRNPGLDLATIEKKYQDILGLEKIIWLPRGILEDEEPTSGPVAPGIYTVGLGGHIDAFCRFANDSTILLSEVGPEMIKVYPFLAETRDRLELNYQVLKKSTDQRGKAFHIVRIPHPDPISSNFLIEDPAYEKYFFGSRLNEQIEYLVTASYLNFIITNGLVVIPAYGDQEKNERVRKIFSEVFPRRQIELLDVLPFNHGGGGFHCITMHQPRI